MDSQSNTAKRIIIGSGCFILLACLSGGCANTFTPPLPSPTAYIPPITISNYKVPAIGSQFNIQFSGDINPDSFSGDIIDLDLFETEPELIIKLQQQGKLVVCYLSAGSWEDWRPDANLYPPALLGNDYAGWPGERWVDIRQIEQLGPILEKRLDLCQEKGFDGVEADNMDNYQNDTGFNIRPEDQLVFNRWVAQQAHQRGLSIGLKNDPDQAAELVDDFDWALAEDCFAESWCEQYEVFLKKGKAVFALEYTDRLPNREEICTLAQKLNINVLFKQRNLNAYQETCFEPF